MKVRSISPMISCCCSAAVCCAAAVGSVWLLLFGTVGPACLLLTLKPRALRSSCRANFACCSGCPSLLLDAPTAATPGRSSSSTTTCLSRAPTTAWCTRRWPPPSSSLHSTASTAPSLPVRGRCCVSHFPCRGCVGGLDTMMRCQADARCPDALPGGYPSARGPLHTRYVLLTLSPAMLAAFLGPSRRCDELGQDAHDDGHGRCARHRAPRHCRGGPARWLLRVDTVRPLRAHHLARVHHVARCSCCSLQPGAC